jgi:ribosome biogenesis GTPase / thiamine phosphate phosphatase
LPIGRVLRIIGGFCFVAARDGEGPELRCAMKGRLKLETEGILVGDWVEYSTQEDTPIITGLQPRKNFLKRPFIANIDLIILVFAHQKPAPTPGLLAKFLTVAEASEIPYLLVLNKSDLVGEGKADDLANKYQGYGYPVLCTSAVTHQGKTELIDQISNKVAVFAGPSGVGKSALLNMIAPGLHLKTGLLSIKIERGKHTTREVQLLPIDSTTFVADTPGFTQINLDFIEPVDLSWYFPDFTAFRSGCRFTTCIHQAEPECAVKAAVDSGAIAAERYQTYQELLAETERYAKERYR